MFGYVKPSKGDLLVKHYEFYRGLYCGLCDVIRKQVSPALSFALSYDFVFLTLIRGLALDQSFSLAQKRCGIHPLKKRPHATSCPPLEFSAQSALLLTYENVLDDLKDPDTSWAKKLLLRIYAAVLRRDRKKLLKRRPELEALAKEISAGLAEVSRLEKAGCNDTDAFCAAFGGLMASLFSFGLEGSEAAVCREIGDYTGRLIYLSDACDDLEKDEKSGSFNPLLLRYGSAGCARENYRELDLVLSLYASRLDAAIGLFSSEKEYKKIAENITTHGIGALSRSVLRPTGK